MGRVQRVSLQCAGIVVTLVVWEVVGRIMGEALFAPVSMVIQEYLGLLRDGTMLAELFGSLQQMLVGFALACVVGMPLGIAMGRSQVCDVIFHPWVSMCVVISVAALVPLFLLLFGSGFAFRAAIVFMASAWYVVLTTYHGARGVDPRYQDVARSFAASRTRLFWKVLMPALYPYLITGARIGLVHAIRAMVVAEMYVIVGYGGLIHKTGLSPSTAPLLGLLITLMAVSLLANTGLYVDRTGPFTGRGIDADVVLDLMVHDIDIVLSLVPSNVKQFDASGKSVISPYLDIAHAQIEFENGCRANMVARRVSEEKVRKVRILQPDGILSLDYLHQTASFSRNVTSPGKERTPETIAEQIPIQKVALLERDIHSFIETVRNRKTDHVSGKDGKRTLEVALQILEKINGPGERRASIERPNG